VTMRVAKPIWLSIDLTQCRPLAASQRSLDADQCADADPVVGIMSCTFFSKGVFIFNDGMAGRPAAASSQ
jgi:hypothetical protein